MRSNWRKPTIPRVSKIASMRSGKTKATSCPKGTKNRKPFTIVIPPPNVTGVLHLGHALDNSLQDVQIRYRRMTGRPTLWVPGTGPCGHRHAETSSRRNCARKARTGGRWGAKPSSKRTWKVTREHKAFINNQLAKIGSSVDWSRERFTLDEGLSKAVREVFVTLYERGLLYKGKYLVNWCTSCGTALSDDEVEHEDENGSMWHIWYELADGPCPECPSGRIEIATTRPETLLGDTAVAAHPEDERYRALHRQNGQTPSHRQDYPHHRRRLCGQDLRNRARQNHPGARSQRLRSREPGTVWSASTFSIPTELFPPRFPKSIAA